MRTSGYNILNLAQAQLEIKDYLESKRCSESQRIFLKNLQQQLEDAHSVSEPEPATAFKIKRSKKEFKERDHQESSVPHEENINRILSATKAAEKIATFVQKEIELEIQKIKGIQAEENSFYHQLLLKINKCAEAVFKASHNIAYNITQRFFEKEPFLFAQGLGAKITVVSQVKDPFLGLSIDMKNPPPGVCYGYAKHGIGPGAFLNAAMLKTHQDQFREASSQTASFSTDLYEQVNLRLEYLSVDRPTMMSIHSYLASHAISIFPNRDRTLYRIFDPNYGKFDLSKNACADFLVFLLTVYSDARGCFFSKINFSNQDNDPISALKADERIIEKLALDLVRFHLASFKQKFVGESPFEKFKVINEFEYIFRYTFNPILKNIKNNEILNVITDEIENVLKKAKVANAALSSSEAEGLKKKAIGYIDQLQNGPHPLTDFYDKTPLAAIVKLKEKVMQSPAILTFDTVLEEWFQEDWKYVRTREYLRLSMKIKGCETCPIAAALEDSKNKMLTKCQNLVASKTRNTLIDLCPPNEILRYKELFDKLSKLPLNPDLEKIIYLIRDHSTTRGKRDTPFQVLLEKIILVDVNNVDGLEELFDQFFSYQEKNQHALSPQVQVSEKKYSDNYLLKISLDKYIGIPEASGIEKWFLFYSKSEKNTAALKVIDLLNNKTPVIFYPIDLNALNDGRLGKIIKQYKHVKEILPLVKILKEKTEVKNEGIEVDQEGYKTVRDNKRHNL